MNLNPSLHFTLLFPSTTHIPSLPLSSLFTFYRLHFPHCFALSNPRFENKKLLIIFDTNSASLLTVTEFQVICLNFE